MQILKTGVLIEKIGTCLQLDNFRLSINYTKTLVAAVKSPKTYYPGKKENVVHHTKIHNIVEQGKAQNLSSFLVLCLQNFNIQTLIQYT